MVAQGVMEVSVLLCLLFSFEQRQSINTNKNLSYSYMTDLEFGGGGGGGGSYIDENAKDTKSEVSNNEGDGYVIIQLQSTLF